MENERVTTSRPILKHLRLKSIACDNQLDGEQRLQVRVSNEIKIGLEEPEIMDGAPTPTAPSAIVLIDFLADFKSEAGDEVQGIAASAKYELRFIFSKGITVEQIEPQMQDETYQYHFVAQAYPVAMIHFKNQLGAMGVSLPGIPLGLA